MGITISNLYSVSFLSGQYINGSGRWSVGETKHELPAVTQYLSVMLEEGESLKMCQNDMTSAFYLFRYRRAGSGFWLST
jgi:hypothetical protein